MKGRKIYGLLITICLIVLPGITRADVDPPPVDDTPIDGGVTLLLAAGVGYGIKKYRDGKRKESEGEVKL